MSRSSFFFSCSSLYAALASSFASLAFFFSTRFLSFSADFFSLASSFFRNFACFFSTFSCFFNSFSTCFFALLSTGVPSLVSFISPCGMAIVMSETPFPTGSVISGFTAASLEMMKSWCSDLYDIDTSSPSSFGINCCSEILSDTIKITFYLK